MPPLDGVRILLVEDDDDTREMVGFALSARGAVMVSVKGSEEGLEAVARERPDVVVSDIAMPGEDGYTFLKRLRALPRGVGRRIPAVALTASTGRDARLASRESGFHYHLTKPVDPDKLTEIVAGLVRLTRGGGDP